MNAVGHRIAATAAVIVAVSVLSWAASPPPTYTAKVERLGSWLPGVVSQGVLPLKSGYAIVDVYGHRVVILDAAKRVVRQVGRIGQETGSFFKPVAAGVDGKQRLYVLDDVAQRLQVMTLEGATLDSWRIPSGTAGFAVTSAGHVLVGNPHRREMITEYDSSGRELRTFGALRRMSDLWGPDVADMDDMHRFAANRVHLAVDGADNVYVAYQNAPVLAKFDRNRRLVFERKMEGPRADRLRSEFSRLRNAPSRHGFSGDGVSGPYIATGIAVDDAGTSYVSLQWDDTWIYVSRADGTAAGVMQNESPAMRVHSLVFDPQRRVLLAPRLSIRGYDAIFEFTIPDMNGS